MRDGISWLERLKVGDPVIVEERADAGTIMHACRVVAISQDTGAITVSPPFSQTVFNRRGISSLPGGVSLFLTRPTKIRLLEAELQGEARTLVARLCSKNWGSVPGHVLRRVYDLVKPYST